MEIFKALGGWYMRDERGVERLLLAPDDPLPIAVITESKSPR